MHPLNVRNGLISALALAAVVLAGPSLAQNEAPPIPDQKLEQYAVAYVRAQGVIQEFQLKATEAESEEETDQLHKQYSEELTKAVRSNGLSLEEYNEITSAVQKDPELRKKVSEMVSEEVN